MPESAYIFYEVRIVLARTLEFSSLGIGFSVSSPHLMQGLLHPIAINLYVLGYADY